MSKFYKKFFLWFALFSPIYIVLILSCTLRANVDLYLPGNLTDVSKEVVVDGYKNKLNGSVSSVYVMDIRKPTYFTYALSTVFPFSASSYITKSSDASYDRELNYAIGVHDSEKSFNDASLAAFEALGDKINFSYKEVTYIYRADKTIISTMKYTEVVGKTIKRVDLIDSDYPTLEVVYEHLSGLSAGESVSMVLEDSKKKEYPVTFTKREDSTFGLTTARDYMIIDSPEVSVKNVFTQGPSGGAMQALYIYLLLSDEDLLKGRKIAGTGTIGYDKTNLYPDMAFGVVGAIGCVGQKLYSAYQDHAKVFYCPESNYSECMNYYNKYGFDENDIRVVSVKTLSDILNDLRSTN